MVLCMVSDRFTTAANSCRRWSRLLFGCRRSWNHLHWVALMRTRNRALKSNAVTKDVKCEQ